MKKLLPLLRRVWTIARRELAMMFNHPTGYVLLVVLLGVNAFLCFRQVYVEGLATLRPMFDMLPWLFLFFVPAVTMRTLAEDSRSGVLEVVLTQPITEAELLLGKFAGATLFLWIALALTLPIPLGLALGSHMAWGTVIAQYTGGALLAAGLAGVGVWASSLTRSQITAFILAVAVTFALILVGLNDLLVGLPPGLSSIAARLGVLSHFESIGRGVIDVRDAIYFVSLAAVFIGFAYGAVAGRALTRTGVRRKRLRTGVALVVALLVIVNLMGGYIGGRLDLTPGHSYTLSRGAKQIAGHLDDLVTIKEFASDELPTQASLMKRDVDDLLTDFRSASHGRIRVLKQNPGKDSIAMRDARELGVEPVQFNVVGASELQVKQGWLGLVVQYGTGHETIPFVSSTDDLEYRLAASIRSLTRTVKPEVGIVENAGVLDQRSQGNGLQRMRSELGKSYDVRDISLADTTQPDGKLTTLILAGSPDSLPAGAAARIGAFFKRGGAALVLAGGGKLDGQSPVAQTRRVAWNEILKPFGVAVDSNIVYDLVSNEMVPSQGSAGPFQVMERYPFFVRAQSTGDSPVNHDVRDVFLPWPSSIDVSKAHPGTVTPLVVTSKGAGSSTGMTMIQPGTKLPENNLSQKVLAVQVAPGVHGDTTVHGRVIVVGNSDFATDQFAQEAPENLALALNAVDWLAQDDALIAIRASDRTPPALAFGSAAVAQAVKYMVMIGVPVLVAVAGTVRTGRRRARSRMPYRARPAVIPGDAKPMEAV
ncbi:MAG TPA: Gldg family protein [Gemmatimonadaceae bacterium]|nr:Gldg family protein [Gemmatimonadaceae bacterium]